MKKFDIRKIRLKTTRIDQIDDRMLLINLYATQAITLIIGFIWLLFQGRNPNSLFRARRNDGFPLLGGGLGCRRHRGRRARGAVRAGRSQRRRRRQRPDFPQPPVWHIAALSLDRGDLRGNLVPRSRPIPYRTILDEHYLRDHPCPLFKALDSDRARVLISYALGWIYIKTGTLLAPIIAHFIIDLVMGLVIRFRREA